MFAICPAEILQNRELNAQDVRVYMAIAGFTDKNGVCFPSVSRIADICGISRRTVFRILSKLEQLKIISRQRRMRDDGGYSSNLYIVPSMTQDSVNNDTGGSANNDTRGSVIDDTANHKQFKQNINLKFIQGARTHTREDGYLINEDKPVLEMADSNDIKYLFEKYKKAKQYSYVKLKGGVIGIRPLSAIGKNEMKDEIIKFLTDICGREARFLKFDEHFTNEIKIDV